MDASARKDEAVSRIGGDGKSATLGDDADELEPRAANAMAESQGRERPVFGSRMTAWAWGLWKSNMPSKGPASASADCSRSLARPRLHNRL
jgi:hypothetical protein